MVKEYVWEYEDFLMPNIMIKADTMEELKKKVMRFINNNGGHQCFDYNMSTVTTVYDDRIVDIRNSLKQYSRKCKEL